MLLVAPSPTPSPGIVIVIEHTGWDWSTDVAIAAALVAVLALVLNFLTIPKGRLWFDPDPDHKAVWVYNLGDGDLFSVFFRVVPTEGAPPAWDGWGIIPPYRTKTGPGERFTVNPGEKLQVRYSVAPFHSLVRRRTYRGPKAVPLVQGL